MNRRGISAAVFLLALLAAAATGLLTARTAAATTGKALIFMGNDPGVPATPTYTGFAAGADKTLDTVTTLPSDLAQYACIVLSVNQTAFTSAQKTALGSYVNGGGRLIALAEYDGAAPAANATMNDLASALGSTMSVVAAVLGPGATTTTNIDSHLFTGGVSRIEFGGSSTVAPGSGGSSLVRSVEGHTILAAQKLGSGFFVLSGDHNMFSDHNGAAYTTHDNGKLVHNICNAVDTGGPGTPPPPPPPPPPGGDCSISAFAHLNVTGGRSVRRAFVGASVQSSGGSAVGSVAWSDRVGRGFSAQSLAIDEVDCDGDEATVRGTARTNWYGLQPFVLVLVDGGTAGPSGDSAHMTVGQYAVGATAWLGNISVID